MQCRSGRFRGLAIILGLAVIIGIWLVSSYNGLVSQRAGVDGAWAQVETQYQRRFDLIPNLVETVKGAANFEQSTLQGVTEARTKWMQAPEQSTDPQVQRAERIAAAEAFDSALSRLLVTVEAYPQLQSVQAFRDLMTQLEGTENRIATARHDFNEQVQMYNVRVKRFPGMVAAKLFGFESEAFFDAAPGTEIAPTIDFE
jgi:LemA protein